jgi:Icc-related predicted phosphoesterase
MLNLHKDVSNSVDKIVFCSHHVHFPEGVIIKNKLQWDFNNAFVGSRSIGEYVLSQKKVDLILFAHTHENGEYKVNTHIRAFNPSFQNAKPDFMVIDYPT